MGRMLDSERSDYEGRIKGLVRLAVELVELREGGLMADEEDSVLRGRVERLGRCRLSPRERGKRTRVLPPRIDSGMIKRRAVRSRFTKIHPSR